MTGYENYQDSNVMWIGSIPAHWELSKAKRYVRITNGDRPTTEGDIPVYGSGKKPFMTCGEYKTGPTVLLERKGTINNPAYVEGLYWNVDTAFDVKPLREDISIKYYYYLVTRFEYGFYMTQTAIPSMTQTDYYNMYIPVPPIEEQEQIAHFLDWKVTAIDKLIAIRKEELTNLADLKKAVITREVTWGNWEYVKLRHILRPVSVKNHPELPLLSVTREKGVIVRDVEDFESNRNFIPDDLSGYKVVQPGQLVINKMKAWQGSCGISDYTGIVSPAYFVFDVKFDNLRFFHHAIRSSIYVDFFAQASDGIRVGQWDLQMAKIKDIPFLCPPTNEQKRIADYLDRKCVQIDSAITNFTQQIDTLKELKARLISDTVTGKIDVRNIPVPEQERKS